MNPNHGEKDWISGGYLNSCYAGCPFGHADVSSISSISTIADFQKPLCHIRLLVAPLRHADCIEPSQPSRVTRKTECHAACSSRGYDGMDEWGGNQLKGSRAPRRRRYCRHIPADRARDGDLLRD